MSAATALRRDSSGDVACVKSLHISSAIACLYRPSLHDGKAIKVLLLELGSKIDERGHVEVMVKKQERRVGCPVIRLRPVGEVSESLTCAENVSRASVFRAMVSLLCIPS